MVSARARLTRPKRKTTILSSIPKWAAAKADGHHPIARYQYRTATPPWMRTIPATSKPRMLQPNLEVTTTPRLPQLMGAKTASYNLAGESWGFPKYRISHSLFLPSSNSFFSFAFSEVSSSQVNFFKMLDEKIENGAEFDEAEEDKKRKEELKKCMKEWEQILSSSKDQQQQQHQHNRQKASANKKVTPMESSNKPKCDRRPSKSKGEPVAVHNSQQNGGGSRPTSAMGTRRKKE